MALLTNVSGTWWGTQPKTKRSPAFWSSSYPLTAVWFINNKASLSTLWMGGGVGEANIGSYMARMLQASCFGAVITQVGVFVSFASSLNTPGSILPSLFFFFCQRLSFSIQGLFQKNFHWNLSFLTHSLSSLIKLLCNNKRVSKTTDCSPFQTVPRLCSCFALPCIAQFLLSPKSSPKLQVLEERGIKDWVTELEQHLGAKYLIPSCPSLQ